MTPAAYLRLRRAAAGLSHEDAAAALAPRIADRSLAATLLRLWETDGVIGEAEDIARLSHVYPLDIFVYRQLCEEPADRHPRICTGCGCSANDACVRNLSANCHWIADDLCSACAESVTVSPAAWMRHAINRTTGEGLRA